MLASSPILKLQESKDFGKVGCYSTKLSNNMGGSPEVVFSTVLGEDAYKDFVIDDLAASGITVKAVIDRSRPSVNKNAIVVGGYRLLKIDTLDNQYMLYLRNGLFKYGRLQVTSDVSKQKYPTTTLPPASRHSCRTMPPASRSRNVSTAVASDTPK